ncbi:MAG TPA: Mth938-like domain-containing protein [Candidatus Tectomicrobia bacterium]|nr:Mth938-like domain-containing protein [Candidatus Tectomicrobia bacterium]
MSNICATRITHLSWGHMEVTVNGHTYRFKDCKVWPGGAKEWDWNLTGTRHRPGIQPADIEEILAHNVDVVVLSRGMERMLQTSAEAEQQLQARGLEYHIMETQDAVDLFNRLTQQGKRVGGVFHSTC